MFRNKRHYKILRDQRGQSTTEYILILAIVVMIVVKFKDEIQTRISSATSNVGGRIEELTNDTGN